MTLSSSSDQSEPMNADAPVITRPRFNESDAIRAFDEWGANCGPGAIAAIYGLTLDELRPHMGCFEQRPARYTNPRLMREILASLYPLTGRRWKWKRVESYRAWPNYGLARVQWEGPWTRPSVPIRVRQRHTHWVGAATRRNGEVGIFDINAINNGSGWVSLEHWTSIVVPWLLPICAPKADGGWHLTHVVEVESVKVVDSASVAPAMASTSDPETP